MTKGYQTGIIGKSGAVKYCNHSEFISESAKYPETSSGRQKTIHQFRCCRATVIPPKAGKPGDLP